MNLRWTEYETLVNEVCWQVGEVFDIHKKELGSVPTVPIVPIKKYGLESLYNACFTILIPYFHITKCFSLVAFYNRR